MNKFKKWMALSLCASLLAACGGGGGNPGSTNNGGSNNPAKVTSVVLTASAATIDSSGADGTEVTLTAIVKDANNAAMSEQTVVFKADSGSISSSAKTTDTSGAVSEKLSVKGDPSNRTITVTATSGGVTSAPIKINVVTAMPVLSLTADAGVLQSAGAAGAEVTLTALVKDASNNVVPGVKVDLSADSGSLTLGTRITDANGKVTEKLSTGGDPTSRAIKVTAKVTGTQPVTTTVNVVGTRVQVNSSSIVNVGSVTDVAVKVVDSAGNALVGKPVTFGSSVAGRLTVKGGGAAVTNTGGQLTLSYTATGAAGADTITVGSLGETATFAISVSSANFSVAVVSGGVVQTLAAINTCHMVAIHSDTGGVAQTGNVALSTSRGDVYSDANCTTLLNGPLTLVNGNATGYVRATGPGVATLNATTSANGVTVQGVIEFVAPLTAASTVSIQADPAVVGANTAGSTAQQTTLRALVRDGTAQNNLVKNAQVTFSILTDPSGGTLTQPSVVTTGSDGSASVSYIAGTTATQLDGVQIQARVQGVNASAIARLTVARKSLFISAGTGATVATPNSSTYRLDYSVFVTDAAGNPVPGVNVTGSVRPRTYHKGTLTYIGLDGPWQYTGGLGVPAASCANEDVDSDGILSGGEDLNGNGVLDPGIPVIVTPAVTTDAGGQALVSLTYARDRANWLDVDLTIRGQVSGTEARYNGLVRLPGLATDYGDAGVSPPGRNSPYGVSSSCSNPN
ncbi:Ig-like domain-containing protein [Pseudoduganella namucuonensis]|nr:Ig-like domain-containing protein [Pseudoduganella namucuonensis]